MKRFLFKHPILSVAVAAVAFFVVLPKVVEKIKES